MTTAWQVERGALARALSASVLWASCAGRKLRRAIGAISLALATLLLSFSAAQAQTATTTALTASPNSGIFQKPVSFTATVTGSGGTPTGSVTFTDTTTSQTLGTITLIAGVATVTTSTLTVGSHTIQAVYSGDSNFNSSSTSISFTVDKNTAGAGIGSNANPSSFGQPVAFTSFVNSNPPGPVTPTGTVTFANQSTGQTLGTAPISGGQATLTISTLPVGNNVITATYNGDSNFFGGGGGLTQAVNKDDTTTTLTSSPQIGSKCGESVTFVTVVSPNAPGAGAPTGTVTYTDLTTGQTLTTLVFKLPKACNRTPLLLRRWRSANMSFKALTVVTPISTAAPRHSISKSASVTRRRH